MDSNKQFQHVKHILSKNIWMKCMKIYELQHYEYVQNTIRLEIIEKKKIST